MSARDELYAYTTVAFKDTGVPEVVHNHVTKMLDAFRAQVLDDAAGDLEVIDPVEWALAGQMAGCDAAQKLRDKAKERTCQRCKGNRADTDDPGDWISEVGRHNPLTAGPCPECNGTGYVAVGER